VVYQDKDGILWFGTAASRSEGAVARYDGQQFTVFNQANSPFRTPVRAIVEDGQGILWFATVGDGAVHYDGTSFRRFTKQDGLAHDYLTSAVVDGRGRVWFGTWGFGISRYDGSSWTNFTTAEGLIDPMIYCGLASRQGHLWFGTLAAGIVRYDGEFVSHYTALADGTPLKYAFSIIETSQKDLLAGGMFGVARFDKDRFVQYLAPHSSRSTLNDLVEDNQGDLWIAQGGAPLGRYDGQTMEYFSQAQGGFNHIHSGRDGSMWLVGLKTPLQRFDGERLHTYDTEGFPQVVQSFWLDRDERWWLGTNDGVYLYDGQHVEKWSSQLDGQKINAVFQDRRGHLWFGGRSLYHYDGERLHHIANAEISPTSTWITAFLEDRAGRLWIGNFGKGVHLYDGTVFQTLTYRDVLLRNSVQELFEAEDGTIWIGSDVGITHYRPKRQPPVASIEEISADRIYGPVDRLVLPSTQHFVRFAFGASSFTTPADRMVYLYRLQGYQEEWKQTRQRRVEYHDLPPNQYQFQVKAVDRDLNYSEPATVDLEIYYQSTQVPITLDQIQLENVFASFYSTYARSPLGTAQVTNHTPEPTEVLLRFFLPDWMRQPNEQRVLLAPDSTYQVPLYAPLGPAILEQVEAVSVQAEITLVFEVGDETLSREKKQPLTLHGCGALTWDTVGRAAAFIISTDPNITQFTRPLLQAFEAELDTQGPPTRNLSRALILFEALKQHGLRYAADANTPYSQVQADRAAVDHIQSGPDPGEQDGRL
jgi:streptogramin lyase